MFGGAVEYYRVYGTLKCDFPSLSCSLKHFTNGIHRFSNNESVFNPALARA